MAEHQLGIRDVWAKKLAESEPVAINRSEPCSKDFFRRNVAEPALAEIGLESYLVKDLRNSCVVNMIEGDMLGKPVPPEVVSYHVDHRSLDMTLGVYHQHRPKHANAFLGALQSDSLSGDPLADRDPTR